MKLRRLGLALLISLPMAPVTFATAESVDSDHQSVNVSPSASGPVVTQGTAGFDSSGIAAGANAGSLPQIGVSGSGSNFSYVPIPDNLMVTTAWPPVVQGGAIIKPGTGFQAACPPAQTGYYVYDSSGQPLGTVCVAATTSGTPNELALAQEASSRQPWPSIAVGVNPSKGLTGLSSWFWLTPPNASIAPATATAGPLTVTVRASLIDVLWNFGDGSELDSGLSFGLAYPQQSGIDHVYQTDTYQQAAGYQVSATLRFTVSYSVNGGPWRFLGTKAKSYLLSYPVNQIQPEGVSASP